MSIRVFFASLLLLLCAASCTAAEKFNIEVAGGAVSGTDEFSVTKTSSGYTMTGRTNLVLQGRPATAEHETAYDANWSPLTYKLNGNVDGAKQKISAVRRDKQIELSVEADGAKSASVDVKANTVLMDNLVVGHFQALLNSLSGKPPAEPLWLVVPQALQALPGTLSEAGEAAGTLDGKTLRLRKYTMTAGALELRFWAETGSQRLMRVSVESQQVEIVREGFAMAADAPSDNQPDGKTSGAK